MVVDTKAKPGKMVKIGAEGGEGQSFKLIIPQLPSFWRIKKKVSEQKSTKIYSRTLKKGAQN
jgi:hypothetical protein